MSVRDLHPLLRRQLRRLERNTVGDASIDLIDLVNQAYREADVDREMLERSLDLSSQELLQANAQMRAVFEAFPDTFLWLEPDGTILRVKSGTGTPPNLPGYHVGNSVLASADAVAEKYRQAIRQVKEGARLASFEYAQSGLEEAHFEVRLLPLVWGQMLVIVRDITLRKLNEAEHLRASKLDSVGLLAGGIAHDFNNILTAILGNVSLSQMLLDDAEFDAIEMAALLQEVLQAGDMARGLTRQLLTFATGGTPVKEAASIGTLIRECTQFSLRGSNVVCSFALAEDLHLIEVDTGQLSQVINNLVINADHAQPLGGAVRVSAVNADDHAEDLDCKHAILISVQDSGTGISEAHIDKIFDPYFTTKPKGSGLGLATCYAIINNHGGTLSVGSTSSQGTRFDILLPANERTTIVADLRRVESPKTVSGGWVLFMDDEPGIRKMGERMLLSLGYRVVLASSGEQAVQCHRDAHERGAAFAFVVLDLTVPGGMGGVDAIGQMRALQPEMLGIASSGYSDTRAMSNPRGSGFDAILKKPYLREDLIEAITRFGPSD